MRLPSFFTLSLQSTHESYIESLFESYRNSPTLHLEQLMLLFSQTTQPFILVLHSLQWTEFIFEKKIF